MSSTVLIGLLLLAAAAAATLFLIRSRKAPPEGETAAASDDQAVLDQLAAAGSDLSKPHHVEFYLYFPTEQAAQQAAEKLEAEGFEGEMKRAADLSSWLCLVNQQMVPDLPKITATKRRLAAVAREFGGEYDGWETKVEK